MRARVGVLEGVAWSRPETDQARRLAMSVLGNGLDLDAQHHEDALSVQEAQLSMKRRLGVPEHNIFAAQTNLATTYHQLGRFDECLQMQRDVYGRVKLNGAEHGATLGSALNYASTLNELERFEEARALMQKSVPVARRVLGENHEDTLRLKWILATTLCRDDAATLADLREAVTTLEETERTARRVLGAAHPLTEG